MDSLSRITDMCQVFLSLFYFWGDCGDEVGAATWVTSPRVPFTNLYDRLKKHIPYRQAPVKKLNLRIPYIMKYFTNVPKLHNLWTGARRCIFISYT